MKNRMQAAVLAAGLCLTISLAPRAEEPGRKFSHPRDITNPYLPLSSLKQDVLEGHEGKHKVRIERTARPEKKKTFKLDGQEVVALAVEDRDYTDGVLTEVTLDYFAQDDQGTVYYLGEEVDHYKKGKIVGHQGAWMLGAEATQPGILVPANPKVGARFRSEDVPGVTQEDCEVVSLSETVTVPAGTYKNCLKIKEVASGESPEFKYYAPGVGVVKEAPEEGEVLLKERATK